VLASFKINTNTLNTTSQECTKSAVLELKITYSFLENTQMFSTDQRRLEINFRYPLGMHKVVTYTALVAGSTGCSPEQRRKGFFKIFFNISRILGT